MQQNGLVRRIGILEDAFENWTSIAQNLFVALKLLKADTHTTQYFIYFD
jgi:hypothetical protein